MKIKINSEEELLEVARDALHILSKLRTSTKLWNAHFGAPLRERKQYWEEQADLFLEKLQVKEHKTVGEINIEVKDAD